MNMHLLSKNIFVQTIGLTKALRKEIMHRTRLRNRYNDHRTEENFKVYKKQRNKCAA